MEEEKEGGWVTEGGSWKGLLCSFIGSTITNIPSVNLAVQHNTDDDALAPELSQTFFVCEVFTVTQHSYTSPLLESVVNKSKERKERSGGVVNMGTETKWAPLL